MGMAVGGSKGAKSDINVTPLVDVCLVLLIIFMVMVPRNVPEISVRVPPESKDVQPRPTEETLVVGMSKDGVLTLNRMPIDRARLGEAIRKQMEFREKKVIFLDFDDEARYGAAVDVFDLAKENGAEVLGVVKKRDKKTPDTLRGV